jgi:phage regulator Rha-like protein
VIAIERTNVRKQIKVQLAHLIIVFLRNPLYTRELSKLSKMYRNKKSGCRLMLHFGSRGN